MFGIRLKALEVKYINLYLAHHKIRVSKKLRETSEAPTTTIRLLITIFGSSVSFLSRRVNIELFVSHSM